MSLDYFSFLHRGIDELLLQHADLFEALGLRLFTSLALITLTMFFIRTALANEGFRMDRFVTLVLVISLGFGMLRYYSNPVPGVGYSFRDLVVEQAHHLAEEIGQERTETLQQRLHVLSEQLEEPGTLSFAAHLLYVLLQMAFIAVNLAVVLVIAFGKVATAVAAMLGPLFIAFFVTPGLDWLFWSWFRSFLQYAFYQVVAAAYLLVFGDFVLGFLEMHQLARPQATIVLAVADWLALFIPLMLVLVLLTFAFGLLQVPSLVRSLFNGRSGETSLPRLW